MAKNGDTHGTQIPVDGDTAESDRAGPPDTTGFMGELVKVPATGVAFALIVRDSSTYVVGDFYEESNIQIVYISGTAADKTPGRVTMSNVKHHTSAQQSSPINNPIYIVSRYLPLRCIKILLVCPTWTAVGDAPVHTCRRRARLAQLFDEFGKLFRLLRVLLEPLF